MASLLKKAAHAAAALLESAIDRLGDPHGGVVMRDALRKARDRGAELAIENARLDDDLERMTRQLDELRDRYSFNGPTLYSDEIAALKKAMGALLDTDDSYNPRASAVIGELLNRSDHIDITSDGLQSMVHGIITGETKTIPWSESPSDRESTFDPDVCPDDDVPRRADWDRVETRDPQGRRNIEFVPRAGNLSRSEPAYCGCNVLFRTAEDWRDHMNPTGVCDGVAVQGPERPNCWHPGPSCHCPQCQGETDVNQ